METFLCAISTLCRSEMEALCAILVCNACWPPAIAACSDCPIKPRSSRLLRASVALMFQDVADIAQKLL